MRVLWYTVVGTWALAALAGTIASGYLWWLMHTLPARDAEVEEAHSYLRRMALSRLFASTAMLGVALAVLAVSPIPSGVRFDDVMPTTITVGAATSLALVLAAFPSVLVTRLVLKELLRVYRAERSS